MKGSPHKEVLERKIDPVRIPESKDNTDIASKSPKQHPRTSYSSPCTSLMQPKSLSIGTHQKGDKNGESVENKEKEESESPLKFTR